ncbi:MAG TPA: hypothetical protein VFI31_11560 [Pirellulales bacterium]|nr:hypothetical protein [Pirellulales bacterium]
MKSALIAGCLALVAIGAPSSAQACHGRGGRGLRGISTQMMSAGMAAMRMVAAQQAIVATQQAAAHQQQVTTYSNLRDQELARREARRQARLASQSSAD